MKNFKIILLISVVVLALGASFSVKAAGQELSGYIYSENAGCWISLSCQNTQSCSNVNYGVTAGSNGSLSGYGFSQNGEWVKFDPNYGGTNIDSSGEISGWAFTDKGDWLRIESVKVSSAQDLESQATSARDTIAQIESQQGSLSDSDVMNLLNSLCNQFLNKDECSVINN